MDRHFLLLVCKPRLLLAFNRDEFFKRPAQPLHLWDDGSGVLAGRDLGSGGTWLGINTRSGRLALLTNLRSRDPIAPTFTGPATCASRGELVTRFLAGSASPGEYVKSIPGDRYNGFNLVVGDLTTDPRVGASFAYTNNSDTDGTVWSGGTAGGWMEGGACGGATAATAPSPAAAVTAAAAAGGRRGGSSRSGSPSQVQLLEPGRVYGLSNGRLMEWPKVATGVEVMQRLVPGVSSDRGVPYDRIFRELMGDSRRLVPPRSPAPETADGGSQGAAHGATDAVPAAPAGAATAGSTAAVNRRSAARPPVGGRPERGNGGCCDGAQRQQTSAAAAATAAATAAQESRAGGGGAGGGGGEVLDVDRFQEQLEHITSGRFVSEVLTPFGPYGTRSQVVIVVWHDGSAEARERHRCDDGSWRDVAVPFQLGAAGYPPSKA